MGFTAKFTAVDSEPRALGNNTQSGRVQIRNMSSTVTVWMFSGEFSNTATATSAEKAAECVSTGFPIGPNSSGTLENQASGVDLGGYFLACANDQSAEVRVIA